MKRSEMIQIIGANFLVSNIENDEFSYPKEFKKQSIVFSPIYNQKGDRKFEKLDLRFVKDNISILIETKTDFTKDLEGAKAQLSAYVEYEKKLNNNRIVAILANTNNDSIMVWRGVVSDMDFMQNEKALRPIDEYVDFYTSKVNDKEKVMSNTYKLNELLHKHGISEQLRSQFVGTCLLALKNGLDYSTTSLTAKQIRARFSEVFENLLNGDIKKQTNFLY